MYEKIVFVLLTLLMVCSMSITAFAAEETPEEQRVENDIKANEQYQRLLENLSTETINSARNVSSDYYGGAYINENGNLVVCVTDDCAANSKMIQTYTGNDEILIKRVGYTYAVLAQEQTRIAELYKAMSEASLNNSSVEELLSLICGTYIDEEKNVLVVEIRNLTEEKVVIFRKLFSDKEFIEFKEGYNNTTTDNWNPGNKIYTSTGGYLSTGYPVYFTNLDGDTERGFITAGHGYVEDDIVYSNNVTGNELGVCIASVFSGDTDAALIQITDANYSISVETAYGGIRLPSTDYVVPAQGSIIYKEGAKTGRTSGTVLSRSQDVYYDDSRKTITDMVQTTALNLKGDSGGVAYASNGYIIGSMSGSGYNGDELNEDTFSCSYICKIENALNILDCSLWE